MKDSNLGRSFKDLIEENERKINDGEEILELDIRSIKPNPEQPRTIFDESSLSELASSIKEHGVIQPIIVKPVGDGYILVAGERRVRASSLAGLTKVPAIVRDYNSIYLSELSILENLQREDLNAVEEARGYDRLKREFGLTQDDVAKSTGKARSTIANSIRLLSLPATVLDLLSSGQIEKGHAKLLASLEPSEAEAAAQNIIKNKLTVKDLSSLSGKKTNKKIPPTKTKDKDLLNIEEEMSEGFGHKIEIEAKNKKSGKVTISYNTSDELENIISKLIN